MALEAHHATVRRELARYRGSEVKSLGDDFLATFDGPARAVRCACEFAEDVRALDIEVRCGLHTGEIGVGEKEVQGIAIHIAARISALAAPNEILDDDAIIMDRPASHSVRFAARSGPSIEISWDGFRELGIWSKPAAPFLCIEPWHGFASPADFDGEFSDKPGLMHIAPAETRTLKYRVRLARAF